MIAVIIVARATKISEIRDFTDGSPEVFAERLVV